MTITEIFNEQLEKLRDYYKHKTDEFHLVFIPDLLKYITVKVLKGAFVESQSFSEWIQSFPEVCSTIKGKKPVKTLQN
jgi:hypothetical protein